MQIIFPESLDYRTLCGNSKTFINIWYHSRQPPTLLRIYWFQWKLNNLFMTFIVSSKHFYANCRYTYIICTTYANNKFQPPMWSTSSQVNRVFLLLDGWDRQQPLLNDYTSQYRLKYVLKLYAILVTLYVQARHFSFTSFWLVKCELVTLKNVCFCGSSVYWIYP